MDRHDLTDGHWAIIPPLLPTKGRRMAQGDDRRVINSTLRRFRAKSPRDVPERYDPRTTLHNRVVRWRAKGIGERILACRVRRCRRGHRHDRCLVRVGSPTLGRHRKGGGDHRCMGRSRDGLSTKIHALIHADGRPRALGQVGDAPAALRPIGDLRRVSILITDRADNIDVIRAHATGRDAWATIPLRMICLGLRKLSIPVACVDAVQLARA